MTRVSTKLLTGTAACAVVLGVVVLGVRLATRGEPVDESRRPTSPPEGPSEPEQPSAVPRITGVDGGVATGSDAELRSAEPSGELEQGARDAREAREAIGATSRELAVRLVAPCRLWKSVQLELVDELGERLVGAGTDQVTWTGLDAQRYTATCVSPGWWPASIEVDLRAAPSRSGAELRLTPRYTLTGSVLDRTTLEPIAGASVEARGRSVNAAGVAFERPLGTAVATDDAGRFCLVQFTDFGAAETRLEATATGFGAADCGWLPFPSTPRIEELVILLERGNGTLCRVEGVVRDRDSGLPLGGARVALAGVETAPDDVWRHGDSMTAPELEAESPAPAAHGRTGPGHQATTGVDGRFSIDARALGDARLVVALTGYTLTISEPLALRRGEVLRADCELTKGHAVFGRIDVPPDDASFASARVQLIGPNGSFSEPVEAGGGFAIAGVADGDYEFRVMVERADDEDETGAYAATVRRVAVAGRDVELYLSVGLALEGTTIRGTVVRPPALESGAWRVGILAGPSRDGLRNSRPVEVDGSFEITEVEPGPVIVLVAGRSEDGSLHAIDVQQLVVSADALVQDVALDATTTCVRGLVRAAGVAAARARVSVAAPDSPYALLFPLLLDVKADERGEFAVWGLPPGAYTFSAASASSAGGGDATARAVIPEGFRGELTAVIDF
jgi:hypothetical protein